MDLTKFKERYTEFLYLMKKRGYSEEYIKKFATIAQLILNEGEDDSIETYEQFYYHMVECHQHTDRTNNEYKNLIGRLKVFVEEGVFLGDTGAFSGFLDFKAYDHLSQSFKRRIQVINARSVYNTRNIEVIKINTAPTVKVQFRLISLTIYIIS